MLIGYMRVSITEQNLALQRDALKAAGCDRTYEDTCSGSLTDRPGLSLALDNLREGDALVVWKLDRIGRSLGHVVPLVGGLHAKRTLAGLAAARARGRTGGRPRLMTRAKLRTAMIMMADCNNVPADIAEQLGISISTLYAYVDGEGHAKPGAMKLLGS